VTVIPASPPRWTPRWPFAKRDQRLHPHLRNIPPTTRKAREHRYRFEASFRDITTNQQSCQQTKLLDRSLRARHLVRYVVPPHLTSKSTSLTLYSSQMSPKLSSQSLRTTMSKPSLHRPSSNTTKNNSPQPSYQAAAPKY
jgi:hypothetical protein